MKIRLIDFGVTKEHCPFRPHENDAGADVYIPFDCTLKPGDIIKIPLGFGLEIPAGYAGYVFPRSSLAVKGLVCELPPIDSGSWHKPWHRSFWKYWGVSLSPNRVPTYEPAPWHSNNTQWTIKGRFFIMITFREK